MKATKYEVIRLTREKETRTGTREIVVDIRIGDVIKVMHIEPKVVTGRVNEIDDDYLIIDGSQMYHSQIIKLPYNEMIWVQKIKRSKGTEEE